MAIPNTFTNGSVIDADEHNENFSYVEPWTKIIYGAGTAGIIKFSSLIWQTSTNRTTDGGANWSGSGYNQVAGEDLAAASGANGVAVDQSDGSTSFSSDSGANWSASSTQPPNISEARGIDISGTTAIIVGLASSGSSIWYSSDGGDNYAQATVDAGAFERVSMVSSTVGYAFKASNDIYKTTDGGANWSDTTDDATIGGSMISADSDTVYFISATTLQFQKYVNSTNTVTTELLLNGLVGRCSNLIKSTNGDIVWAFWTTGATFGSPAELYLYRFDGTNIYVKNIGQPKLEDWTGIWTTGGNTIPTIMEVSNKININVGGHILEVHVQ